MSPLHLAEEQDGYRGSGEGVGGPTPPPGGAHPTPRSPIPTLFFDTVTVAGKWLTKVLLGRQ